MARAKTQPGPSKTSTDELVPANQQAKSWPCPALNLDIALGLLSLLPPNLEQGSFLAAPSLSQIQSMVSRLKQG